MKETWVPMVIYIIYNFQGCVFFSFFVEEINRPQYLQRQIWIRVGVGQALFPKAPGFGQWLFLVAIKGGIGSIYNPPEGNI